MALDPEGVVELDAGGQRYRLFFGMRAMKAIETHYDKPFFKAVRAVMPDLAPEDMNDKAKVAAASMNIRLTDVAKLFECAFLKFHPESDADEIDNIIDEIGLQRASEVLGLALAAAMVPDDKGGAATANPPHASRKKPTGSRSLRTGSVPA
jgi:hypothetical protein